MIYAIPSFLFGMLACWLVMRPIIKRERKLEDSKREQLLDVVEQQQRQIESLQDYETQLADRCWRAEHSRVEEEEWPEVIGQ